MGEVLEFMVLLPNTTRPRWKRRRLNQNLYTELKYMYIYMQVVHITIGSGKRGSGIVSANQYITEKFVVLVGFFGEKLSFNRCLKKHKKYLQLPYYMFFFEIQEQRKIRSSLQNSKKMEAQIPDSVRGACGHMLYTYKFSKLTSS